jgi:hypothetical protein
VGGLEFHFEFEAARFEILADAALGGNFGVQEFCALGLNFFFNFVPAFELFGVTLRAQMMFTHAD